MTWLVWKQSFQHKRHSQTGEFGSEKYQRSLTMGKIINRENVVILLCLLSFLFFLNCVKKKNNFRETHREIAKKEIISEIGNNKRIEKITNSEFSISDTSEIDKDILAYINNNPGLPGFIKRALVHRYPVNLMSIEEFLLINDNLINDYVIIINKNEPDIFTIGPRECYSIKTNYFKCGTIWQFKYGFLWSWGEI